MRTRSFIILIIFSISILTTCKKQDNNVWIEDIDFLSKQFPKLHKDFYKLINSNDFNHKLETLKNNIDSLDDITIEIELQRILASLHVSHTMIPIQYGSTFYNLPISVEIFDDGLFILGIDASKQEYLTHRIVSINNIPVEEIYKRLEPLISYENEYWLKSQIPKFLIKPQILKYINVTGDEKHITFQLDNDISFDLPIQQTETEMSYWPLWTEVTWLKNQNKFYWYEVISKDILYIQYNKCQEDRKYSFDEFINDITATIDKNWINTILIDLRLNTGGNSKIIKPLISKLKRYDNKKFYGAISRNTFSSGRFAARDLKVQLNAILIGEPTGGSPEAYGDIRRLTLPNSKIMINYCTKYFSLLDTDKNYFEPDIRLDFKSKDFFEGKDLVLEYVKNIDESIEAK